LIRKMTQILFCIINYEKRWIQLKACSKICSEGQLNAC
jgi:hypothetical protein